MSVATLVINWLNKEYGIKLDAAYYDYIQEWKEWWEGYNSDFHKYRIYDAGGNAHGHDLYSLRMGKKVCEDWASILLNEKTLITTEHTASTEFLIGKDGVSGVLGQNRFWQRGNELVEKAFAFGTGAVILRFDGVAVKSDGGITPDAETRIKLDYLPAESIIPLSIESGCITEAAFVSEVLSKGNKFVYVETHTKERGGYKVTNGYFKATKDSLTPAPLPEGMLPEVHFATPYPLFSIVHPNMVNNMRNKNGLGISVYANALDTLKGVDLAYNNLCRDFYLGGKKVFLTTDMLMQTKDGGYMTPDEAMQQLFLKVGDSVSESGKSIHEHNPSLRVQENTDGIQAQLDYLSFKCGFGTKHYQFNAGNVVTATQYMGDRQEMMQNASKHYIIVEEFLTNICRGVLWAGQNLCGAPVDPWTAISIQFEDSYIIDTESQRQRDLQEVSAGLMQKYEYRMKWYGEDEDTAKAVLSSEETDPFNFGGGGLGA